MKLKNSISGTIFDGFNYIFLAAFSIVAVIPFLYVLACSFATDSEIRSRAFFIIPHAFSLDAYKYIFSTSTLLRSIGVSILITVIGTIVNLFFTVTMAYPLSRRALVGKNFILNFVIFTMVFSGGLIPGYIVVKSLHLVNSYWAIWLPGAISTGNLIIVLNFFRELPISLEEAATIDGCTEIQVLYKIVLPLSKPVLATFGLFYAVGHWNNFMGPLLYLNDTTKWPLQIILRQIIMLSQSTLGDAAQLDAAMVAKPPEESMKMAVIIVGMTPIMLVYPFLQKHFAKGVMIGAVKG